MLYQKNITEKGSARKEDDLHSIYLEIDVPDDYRDNGVVARNVFKYKALCREGRVCIAAYNKAGILLKGNIDDLSTQYKLLPVFLVLLAREMETNADWRRMMDQFVEKPVADLFVNLHEEFMLLDRPPISKQFREFLVTQTYSL